MAIASSSSSCALFSGDGRFASAIFSGEYLQAKRAGRKS
jgi:hypothetical protein